MVLRRLVTVLLTALLVPLVASTTSTAVAPVERTTPPEVSVLAVHTRTPLRTAARLQRDGYDLLEARLGRDLLVLGDRSTKRALRRDGYSFSVQQRLANATQTMIPTLARSEELVTILTQLHRLEPTAVRAVQ